ncbi:MAG: hypothetical protein WCP39_07305, partial [Chlamydiota bacterium]
MSNVVESILGSPPLSPVTFELISLFETKAQKNQSWSSLIRASQYSPPNFNPLEGRVTPYGRRSPTRVEESRVLSPSQKEACEKLLSSQIITLSIRNETYTFSVKEFLACFEKRLIITTSLYGNEVFTAARLTGSNAAFILLESKDKPRDLDLSFSFNFSADKKTTICFFDQIRDGFYQALSECLLSKGLNPSLSYPEFQCNCLQIQKLILNEEENWSLLRMCDVDFRFSVLMKREWDFSCRSFQINLPIHNQNPIGFCLYRSFDEALEDAQQKRIKTIFPEGIYNGLERCLFKLEQGFTCKSKEIYQGLIQRFFQNPHKSKEEFLQLFSGYLQGFIGKASSVAEKEQKESTAIEESFMVLEALEERKELQDRLYALLFSFIKNPDFLFQLLQNGFRFCNGSEAVYFSYFDLLDIKRKKSIFLKNCATIIPSLFKKEESALTFLHSLPTATKKDFIHFVEEQDFHFFTKHIGVLQQWYKKDLSFLSQYSQFRIRCLEVFLEQKNLANIELFTLIPSSLATAAKGNPIFFPILDLYITHVTKNQRELCYPLFKNLTPKTP